MEKFAEFNELFADLLLLWANHLLKRTMLIAGELSDDWLEEDEQFFDVDVGGLGVLVHDFFYGVIVGVGNGNFRGD